jgi:AraC-like DNA-binding protein
MTDGRRCTDVSGEQSAAEADVLSSGQGMPRLVFDDRNVARRHQFDAFHEAMAPLFDTGLSCDARDFAVTSTDYQVADIVVSRLQSQPQSVRRDVAHLRDGCTDWFNIVAFHSGQMRGEAGRSTTLDLHHGEIGFLDFANPFTAVMDQSDSTWIAVPRQKIDRADELEATGTISGSEQRSLVLSAAIRELWHELQTSPAEAAERLAQRIVDTINTTLDTDAFTPSDNDLGLAMQDFIKANLRDLDLGAGSVQAFFQCSRASIYRAFGQHGGIATYIRNQRLLRCFEELTRPAEHPLPVNVVATRWGFENPSHFNRIFKAKFGLPPSRVTRPTDPSPERRAHPQASEWIRTVHAWTTSSR